MCVVGIVAEYNPFHNGHEYQLKKVIKELNPKKIYVVMSGDYVQRGGPAICSKEIRAQAAIKAGASEVIELPVHLSVADAPVYANGAVSILNSMGCDTLVFGSECGDISFLKQIASVMTTIEYKQVYNEFIGEGLSPMESRKVALEKICGKDSDMIEYVNQPNNLFGIYFLKSILSNGYNITPITIKRRGQGYLDSDIGVDNKYASATAIRERLNNIKDGDYSEALKKIKELMPSYMYEMLREQCFCGNVFFKEDYFCEIKKCIQACTSEQFEYYFVGIPENIVHNKLIKSSSYCEMIEILTEYVPEVKADRFLFRCYIGNNGMIDCKEKGTSINVLAKKE